MYRFIFSVFILLLAAGSARAQAPFYQGKTITIIVGTKAGDAYDLYPRLLAEFIPSTDGLQDAIETATRELDVPVLLVSGGRSDLVSARTVQHFLELAPHARHVQLPDATHMVAGDDNDAFTDALMQFLSDLAAPHAAAHGDLR